MYFSAQFSVRDFDREFVAVFALPFAHELGRPINLFAILCVIFFLVSIVVQLCKYLNAKELRCNQWRGLHSEEFSNCMDQPPQAEARATGRQPKLLLGAEERKTEQEQDG
jgi:hypothetical protein